LIRELSERSGAKVFCSPRGKGIMPEDHRNYLGVTGLGGHDRVSQHMLTKAPQRILVLGTRLGEATSFWDNDMVPSEGFLHVDIDPEVPGTAFPEAKTLAIQAEVGQFLKALLPFFPSKTQDQPIDIESHRKSRLHRRNKAHHTAAIALRTEGLVRPQALMNAIQRRVVEDTDAVVLAECGNSFAWCNHYLRFREAGRYRVSTLFGSMGHAAAGVVGAALSRKGKAVAVVGDGSMLMNSEISTAVQYGAKAVWLVLNDAAYGMCRDGHQALGLTSANVHFPQVDFVTMAGALGAEGCRIENEAEIEDAFRAAMAAEGPFVIDARIDPSEPSPLLRRFESLIKQGNSKNVAGWERDEA
jgi:acetolactate synthase-1/2/3 large subunit